MLHTVIVKPGSTAECCKVLRRETRLRFKGNTLLGTDGRLSVVTFQKLWPFLANLFLGMTGQHSQLQASLTQIFTHTDECLC